MTEEVSLMASAATTQIILFAEDTSMMATIAKRQNWQILESYTPSSWSRKNLASIERHWSPDSKAVLWIHWDKAVQSMPKEKQEMMSRRLYEVLKKQSQGQIVVESCVEDWPKEAARKLKYRLTRIYTCGLGLKDCVCFRASSVPDRGGVHCSCGRKGQDLPDAKTQEEIYEKVILFLFNANRSACAEKGEALKSVPLEFQHCAGQMTTEAYPTEQAVRQKEAKKKVKASLKRDKGKDEEESAGTGKALRRLRLRLWAN